MDVEIRNAQKDPLSKPPAMRPLWNLHIKDTIVLNIVTPQADYIGTV
jgi:hypothetical protein